MQTRIQVRYGAVQRSASGSYCRIAVRTASSSGLAADVELLVAGFVQGRVANEWRAIYCLELKQSIQLVVDRAQRHVDERPDCAIQPPQLVLIPYVPNVIDIAQPAATFRRRLPMLGQRTTLVYSSNLCAESDDDNMGKQFRCAP